MVPAIRNILGGFLFSGDDVYKRGRVLSGGERTRLAVARMLLRPSNTLLLDEPTNHLDLDSKDVLLDALVDYGGTLIFVSHDRYFVERLATKIIEIGGGAGDRLSRHLHRVPLAQGARRGPRRPAPGASARRDARPRRHRARRSQRTTLAGTPRPAAAAGRDARKKRAMRTRAGSSAPAPGAADADRRPRDAHRRVRGGDPRARGRDGRARASTTTAPPPSRSIDRHQALMWQVGDLMHQWEELQTTRPV